MNKRNCLECGELLRGRADQKYCCDACRNAYHNQKIGNTNRYMRKVNRILKQNHTILEKLNTNGKTVIDKDMLIKEGFKFNYFTHILKLENGKICYFCYDQGLLSVKNKKYGLMKKNVEDY
jgi:DNA-directed RNA polymerase subunit M/transcription elongation factor TFIIS